MLTQAMMACTWEMDKLMVKQQVLDRFRGAHKGPTGPDVHMYTCTYCFSEARAKALRKSTNAGDAGDREATACSAYLHIQEKYPHMCVYIW